MILYYPNEVVCNAENGWTDDSDAHIMPWHAAVDLLVKSVLLPFIEIGKIHHPVVVEVCSNTLDMYSVSKMECLESNLARAKLQLLRCWDGRLPMDAAAGPSVRNKDPSHQ